MYNIDQTEYKQRDTINESFRLTNVLNFKNLSKYHLDEEASFAEDNKGRIFNPNAGKNFKFN